MPLTLTITSYQRLSPGHETSRQLDRGRMRIGRAPENDWVLPDPEMVLSKSHCAVEYRDGDYYLIDTSTNGVFINHADQRVGRGNSVLLNDQDLICLGDYEILAGIGSGDSAVAPPAAPLPDYAGESSDLFSVITELVDVREQFEKASAKLPPAPDSLDLDSPVAPTRDGDPLGLDEEPESPAWQQHTPDDHLPADREFFRPPAAVPDPDLPATKPPADAPTPASGSAPVIPDDWEDSLIFKPPRVPPAAVPDTDHGVPEDDFDLLDDVPPPPVAAPPPSPPSFEPVDEDEAGLRTERIPVPGPAAQPPPTPPATPVAAAHPTRGDGDAAALQAFLRGAGLDNLPLAGGDVAALMQQIGVIFRHTSQGMMDLLRARSSVKNEFRVERTMIMALENNPLKQLPTVEEAMKAMLTRQDNIWMPADKAISEGFADIRAHELAMVAGMQAALKHLLETFDPQQLEQALGEQSRLGDLFGGRKARYWDAFTRLYGKLAAKAEDDFQQLFRQEFAKAYEAQQQKLRQR